MTIAMYFDDLDVSLLREMELDYCIDKQLHPRFSVDINVNSCPNFNGGLAKPTLRLEYRWVITYHILI